MTTEDLLFPLSSVRGCGEQKLVDDSMECAAADMLLGEDSLFNDSLENSTVHEKIIRATLTDPGAEKTPADVGEHCLDDSLDFDATQLPFDETNPGLPITFCSSSSNEDRGAVKSSSLTAGFQMAENIPLSSSSMYDDGLASGVSAVEGDVTKVKANAVDEHSQQGLYNQQMDKNTSSTAGDTSTKSSPTSIASTASVTSDTVSKSKVVPSFGQRKNKKNVSPTAKMDTLTEKKTREEVAPTAKTGTCTNAVKEVAPTPKTGANTIPAMSHKNASEDAEPYDMPEIPSTTRDGCEMNDISGSDEKENREEDQCVPEGAGKGDKPQKPQFTSALKKSSKNQSKNSTSEEDANTTQIEKELSNKSEIGKKKKKLTVRGQKQQVREEKRKEAERKKLEREQKKREAEEKKAEKERLKKERQLELERKKAEREQKKIEQALKKADRLNKKDETLNSKKKTKKIEKADGITARGDEKQTAPSGSDLEQEVPVRVECEAVQRNTSIATSEDKISSGNAQVCGVTQPKENVFLPDDSCQPQSSNDLGMDAAKNSERPHVDCSDGSPVCANEPTTATLPLENADVAECDVAIENVEQERVGVESEEESSDDRKLNPVGQEADKQNEMPMQESKPKIKIVFGPSGHAKKANCMQDVGDALKTKTLAKVSITKINKPKKDPTNSKLAGVSGTGLAKREPLTKSRNTDSKTAKSKRKKPSCREEDGTEPEPKRSKPTNYTGPVWVQCERVSCKKWRQLRDCSDPLSLPGSWNCSMNTDQERSCCSAAEERWSDDVGDSQEYVESPFIPGSLVWAKMDGYPWWPAMVEEDPNEEAYYEMGKRSTSSIPVKYHVVFFDTPVSRGWVSSCHIHPYTADQDHNTSTGASVSQKLRKGLREARKQANRAVTMPIATRLIECSFAKRFRRMASRKRKTKHEDAAADSSFSSGVKLSCDRGRKSLRLSSDRARAKREGEGEGEGGGGHGEGEVGGDRGADDSGTCSERMNPSQT